MDIEHEVNIPTLLQNMHYAGSKDQETGGLRESGLSFFGLYLLTKDVITFLMNME